MTKEERLKKCEAVYDLWHITEWNALSISMKMIDFCMRFRDCVLIHPETYDMFYKYIEEQPHHRNAMHSILRNMEDFKYYFKWSTPEEGMKTRWEKENLEHKRLCVKKTVPSLYNPIMMLSRLMIPCVECACDPNVRETRRWWFHSKECKEKHNKE